jgi:hypothetical protein
LSAVFVKFSSEPGSPVAATERIRLKRGLTMKIFNMFQRIQPETGELQQEVKEADAVVNLAGRTIFKRWTESYKKLMYGQPDPDYAESGRSHTRRSCDSLLQHLCRGLLW